MRRRTNLMAEVLKSPSAQRIIDFVAPIYGESYTALWLYEVIGRVLDEIVFSAGSLKEQTLPQTSTWALPYWEKEYGLSTDSSWTVKQRQANIIAKMKFTPPANPARLAQYASAATGVDCRVIENISKNTFAVSFEGRAGSLERLASVINGAKPAHLIWQINARAFPVECGVSVGGAAARFSRQTFCETQPDRNISCGLHIGGGVTGRYSRVKLKE